MAERYWIASCRRASLRVPTLQQSWRLRTPNGSLDLANCLSSGAGEYNFYAALAGRVCNAARGGKPGPAPEGIGS